MNIVKVNPESYDFGVTPQEEYLEYFDYKNPIRLGENTYRVDEIGRAVPAVTVIERDANITEASGISAEISFVSVDKQMDYYRSTFSQLLDRMERLQQENEIKLNSCYLFLQEKGLLEEYEKTHGAFQSISDLNELVEEIDQSLEKNTGERQADYELENSEEKISEDMIEDNATQEKGWVQIGTVKKRMTI